MENSQDQEREKIRKALVAGDEKFERRRVDYGKQYPLSDQEYFPLKGIGTYGIPTILVDRAIENFFQKNVAYIYRGRNLSDKKASTEVKDIFVKRMKSEHPRDIYSCNYVNESGIWCYKIVRR